MARRRLTDQQRLENKQKWSKYTTERVKQQRRIEYQKQGYKNFYDHIIPGSLNYKILNDVKEGIKDTMSGYAKRYHKTVDEIQHSLNILRKKGYFIHPVGTVRGEFGKEGILADVTENKEHFIESSNNRQKYMSNPSLVRQVESMEIFLEKHPEEYDSILEISETIQTKALEAKKRIREKVKELSHAN